MVNRVVLVGRLIADPELRTTKDGVSFATFRLAADNRMKDSDGTRGSIFINCTVYREQAENLVKNTRKGSKVAVDGSLNQRNFTRQDGSKGSAIEIIIDSVTYLDPNPNKNGNAVDTPKFDDTPSPINGSNLDSIDLPDDDLPF